MCLYNKVLKILLKKYKKNTKKIQENTRNNYCKERKYKHNSEIKKYIF